MNRIKVDKVNVIEDKVIYIYDDKDSNRVFNVENDCILKINHYAFNTSNKVVINLNHKNAELEYHYSTINNSDNVFQLEVNHNEQSTTSNVYNHGVNTANNKLHFDISSKVEKNKEKCICNQENQIINLRQGKSTILPKLLISNYDVTSSHSAYIGKFKDDVMFYLMSRGIRKQEATKLLIKSLLVTENNKSEQLVKFIENIKDI